MKYAARPRLMPGILLALAFGLSAAGVAAAGEEIPYKPGCWVEVPAAAGTIAAPGAATVVDAGAREPQYALPMTGSWISGAGLELSAVSEPGWLVAALEPGPRASPVSRESVLSALPAGSKLVVLPSVRRGVPESVDLVVAYDFAEGQLQPQERDALESFVRRGGAMFFVFASRTIPAASVPLWRQLFGAGGAAEEQAPALPRGLLVPHGFACRFDPELPQLVWQRCGRGVVLAYGLGPYEKAIERPDEAAKLFGRAVRLIGAHRRPVSIGPVEPAAAELFEPPEWSSEPRRRLAALALAYVAAAVGLLVSFGRWLVRRWWTWLAGLALLAACGLGWVAVSGGAASGLALDTAAFLIREPGADPVEVVVGRISRLGPGPSPRLRAAGPMPPKLVLRHPADASLKNWMNYRFEAGGATVEPLLELGQYLCLVSVRTVSAERLRQAAAAPDVPAPPEAERAAGFIQRVRLLGGGTLRWVQPTMPPRLFDSSAEDRFVQVRRSPMLFLISDKP